MRRSAACVGVSAEPPNGLGRELGRTVQQVFGTAEGLLPLTRPGDPEETVLTTHGRSLSPDDDLRIVGADGKDVPPGEPGELLARGPRPAHAARPLPGARRQRPFLHPRRPPPYRFLAHRTADGDLVVTGRLPDAPRT